MSEAKNDKYYFDPDAGKRVINFIERYCRHVKGPLRGELIKLEDWQKEIISDTFGWKYTATGFRRYQYVYVEVPKKNGKSTMLAPISLYLLGWDGEPGAEIYGAAADREQARIVFENASEMVQMSPELSAELDVYKYSITHPASGSWYKVVSAEAYTKHGPNLHAIAFDEIAVQKNADLYDTLRKGIAARQQPMLWMITTAQVVETFGHELHKYAKDVMNGVIQDERWYVKIYGADEKDDIYDPATWYKSNPSLGTALPVQYFENEIQEIKNDPSKVNTFKRLHLNIWTSTTQSWHVADIWDDCDIKPIDPDELKGRPCFGGLDLAYNDDMNAFVMVFPPTDEDPLCHIYPYFWIPEKTVIDRAKREHTQFLQWTQDDVVFTQMYDAIDLLELSEDILELIEGHNFHGLGYDKYRSDEAIRNLESKGVTCWAFRQGPVTFNVVIERLQKMVMNKTLNHAGNPVLRWQVGNVQLYEDRENNKWVHKQKSTGKIDGIVAALNGLCAWMYDEANSEVKPKPYEDRDIIFL